MSSAAGLRRFAGADLRVFRWPFVDLGARAAFRECTVHGSTDHYEMRELANGVLVAESSLSYGPDNQRLPKQCPPRSARDLDPTR